MTKARKHGNTEGTSDIGDYLNSILDYTTSNDVPPGQAIIPFVSLECSFFRIHRLVERRCGQVVESFGYNEHNGRLEETRKSCQRRPTKYTYAPNSHRVSEYHLIIYSTVPNNHAANPY